MAAYLNPPTVCDWCQRDIKDEFIDGRTRNGQWANMCPRCFSKHGVGLGTGSGQRYVKPAGGKHYQKVEG